jgi:subtilisin-like proprotein convertase family protein
VQLEVEHSYIGDLVVTLIPPTDMQATPVKLHDRSGGATRNISWTYDALNVPDLASYRGKSAHGAWTLEVRDEARADVGIIKRFGLELVLTPSERVAVAAATAAHGTYRPESRRRQGLHSSAD